MMKILRRLRKAIKLPKSLLTFPQVSLLGGVENVIPVLSGLIPIIPRARKNTMDYTL